MWRTGRVLAGLAIALSLFLAPTAVASAGEAVAPPQVVVLAQDQPPAPPAEDPGVDTRQRMAIGIGGLVLIGAVLLSRRLRKKPVLFVTWKKS
ncbi:hypothetical protein [Saccharopolyspora oryzae]|uniref:LPXTG cell wall anchor domain-containing protein n=1 Tax=Saccharopolyspora oryzae TaxID=2997343 RepID=A0ABT4UXB9_9PSEU|nr:hypothetical protein [Saccharopolyspora oryzae]MDA3625779.1 hypothetical protein [Saccharopolyspora oryzae]